MCTLFSTQTNDVWLLGTSIQQLIEEHQQVFSATQPRNSPLTFHKVPDWPTFLRNVLQGHGMCQKRIILLCNTNSLSHEDIIRIRMMREKYAWFIPVVYFDQPDLGKIIHTFNADLAGYCAASDSFDEISLMLSTVRRGKFYYSTGFCALLEEYGFKIKENS